HSEGGKRTSVEWPARHRPRLRTARTAPPGRSIPAFGYLPAERRRNGINPVKAIQSGVSMQPNQPTANEMLCAVGFSKDESGYATPGRTNASDSTPAKSRNAGLARPSENIQFDRRMRQITSDYPDPFGPHIIHVYY